MGSSYWPEGNLRTLLETIIENYEEDRERYWSEDATTVRLREFIDAVASSIVASSDELILKPSQEIKLEWAIANEVVESLELSNEVLAKAEILVAWRFATDTDEMARRCVELTKLVLREHPSERVRRFMRRVGRCYVVGLFPEATIACRGVLESAVDEVIQRRAIKGDGRMRGKLQALFREGLISASSRDAAWIIWTRGNTAVHKDPEAVGEVMQTITMTLALLKELQGEGGLGAEGAL